MNKLNNNKAMKTLKKDQDYAEKNAPMQVPEAEMQNKLLYEAPALKLIEVEVEKGFAASLNDYGDETA